MDDIEERLTAFAGANNLQLMEQIGFGIHGRAMCVDAVGSPFSSVIKAFEARESYERERDAYLRLREAEVVSVAGCNVPQYLGSDEELLVIWMSLVTRPFCLDFAAAYLDGLPSYFPPMGEEWEAEKLEQFGAEDWAKVLKVLDRLEFYGIHQTDVTPTNISV